MNHKQRAVLHAIFAHPIGSNIDPRPVHSVLETLGAEVTYGGHGHVLVRLNGHTHGFRSSSHALQRDDVMMLRKFLAMAGIDPARDYPLDSNTT
jgi:hypothetical protein